MKRVKIPEDIQVFLVIVAIVFLLSALASIESIVKYWSR